MAALGHTSTPFCFVIRQLLGFFPGQVHLSEVPFDDIYLVLPRSSWLSLVTSEFPVCCLTSCSRVVHSQDVSQPPEPSFFNNIFQFPWTSFLSDVFISDLVPPCDPQQSPLELMVSCFYFFICVTDSGHDSAPCSRVGMKVTHKAWFSRRGWYSYFSRCLLVSRIHLPPFQFLSCIPWEWEWLTHCRLCVER